MTMPGFTAGASLYETSARYHMTGAPDALAEAGRVSPQVTFRPITLGATCTSTDGKNTCACAGACWAGETSCGCPSAFSTVQAMDVSV
jgi:hypothetical protein